MPLHLALVAVDVDRLTSLLRELDGQLEREAVGRRERERLLPGDRVLVCELLEELEASLDRLAKLFLLDSARALDLGRALRELGIGLGHLVRDGGRQAMDVVEADAATLLHCAPDDALRTYPRPSLDGVTPSATRNVMPRLWSARIRCARVASGESPYATPDCPAIQLMIS